jgi:hypothetical protein
MKNLFASAIVLVVVALLFSSCKKESVKCYSCINKQYSYCGNVQASAFGQSFNFNQCFADSDARNNFITTSENTASNIPGAVVTSTKTDTISVDLSEDVCGTDDRTVQNFVSLWEAQGYTCTAK